ncbi:hypothetical protein C7437_10258 [Psychrobacillus insolitus]|uniref:Uncharacterized protein n=1 Tax=Psychrobacillus insolitus TaxID=1461 RepID=A0A2W7N2Q9_9BACI|nr:hypothetical protein [Psychrobacillus insolitus]PZX05604.1 hypothetical protein C7437_10258 [Psychrobacillus insolitus]
MFETIDQKKQLLDRKSPLPEYTAESLREKLFLEWTYNTNAIEDYTDFVQLVATEVESSLDLYLSAVTIL